MARSYILNEFTIQIQAHVANPHRALGNVKRESVRVTTVYVQDPWLQPTSAASAQVRYSCLFSQPRGANEKREMCSI